MDAKRIAFVCTFALMAGVAGAAPASPAAVASQLKPSDAGPAAPDGGTPATPATAIDKRTGSYDVGLMLGSQLLHSGLTDVAMEDLVRGLKEAAHGHTPTPRGTRWCDAVQSPGARGDGQAKRGGRP